MEQDILVITATLGNRDTLSNTIKSVKEIGGERVKHIIVAPALNIPSIKEKYEDIECLVEPEGKKGIYAALNYGFHTYGKQYKYLTFINDDDYWLPNFNLLIDAIEKNNIELAYGKIGYINNIGEYIKQQACTNQFYSFLSLLHSNIILFTQQATLITSDLYFKLGGFSEQFSLVSDTKFWIDASLLKIDYKYINAECATYRIQERQLSSNKNMQKKETSDLLGLYAKVPKWKQIVDKVKFRILNLNIYIKRFL